MQPRTCAKNDTKKNNLQKLIIAATPGFSDNISSNLSIIFFSFANLTNFNTLTNLKNFNNLINLAL